MPEFYIKIAPTPNFFPNFGGSHPLPRPPSPTPMALTGKLRPVHTADATQLNCRVESRRRCV